MHTFSETGAGVPAFLAKLWRLVEDPETNHLICWSVDGRSFIIQNQAQFARELLPLNYKHNNMASFIRQLNMYGFHKITSIENGGLKFDRDEMEFSHPCFKRDCPYLLEHIKRKIANTKSVVADEKTSLKPEAVNKVLNDVKAMRGRQDSLDSRFSLMKQENEALWREIAALRQKHMKQQQIVNKLIQFLVTIVQPSRNMSGVKRHFQLMINDAPQSSKTRKRSESDSGPVIHELTEELLDEMADPDPDLLNAASPGSSYSNRHETESPSSNIERPRSTFSVSSQQFDNQSNLSTEDATGATQSQLSMNANGSPIIYHVSELPESVDDIDPESGALFDDNELTTPMVKQEMERNQQMLLQQQQEQLSQKTRRRKVSPTRAAPSTSKMMKTSHKPIQIKTETTEIDPMIYLTNSNDGFSNPVTAPTPATTVQGANNNEQMFSQKDFMNSDIPIDIFEDTVLNDINVSTGSYNDKISFRTRPSTSGMSTGTKLNAGNSSSNIPTTDADASANPNKNLTLAKYNNPKYLSDDDIMRQDVNDHLDGMQDDLDSLKDLLRGEGYTLDANTLLGHATTPSPNRMFFSQPLDGDILAKLFSDSDVLNPYSLSLSNDGIQDGGKKGSELMTYQPFYGDLNDILDVSNAKIAGNADNGSKTKSPEPPSSVLNTPYHD